MAGSGGFEGLLSGWDVRIVQAVGLGGGADEEGGVGGVFESDFVDAAAVVNGADAVGFEEFFDDDERDGGHDEGDEHDGGVLDGVIGEYAAAEQQEAEKQGDGEKSGAAEKQLAANSSKTGHAKRNGQNFVQGHRELINGFGWGEAFTAAGSPTQLSGAEDGPCGICLRLAHVTFSAGENAIFVQGEGGRSAGGKNRNAIFEFCVGIDQRAKEELYGEREDGKAKTDGGGDENFRRVDGDARLAGRTDMGVDDEVDKSGGDGTEDGHDKPGLMAGFSIGADGGLVNPMAGRAGDEFDVAL